MLRVTKKIVIWICDSKNVRREEKMEKDFFRKDDYSEATLQNVRDLEEKFDGTLVSIPNRDGIYCYYNGLRFISIKAKSIEPFSKSESKDPQKSEYRNKRNAIRQEILAEKTIEGRIKKYKDNKTSIEWIMEHSMSQDAERYSQQVIVKRNMSFDDDDYSACGMETTIPSRYLSVQPNGKRKQAEVDIVIINPKQKKIYLVEYKCGKKMDLCQYFGHKKLNFFSLHDINTERKITKLQEPHLQPAVEFYNPVHCASFCGYTKTLYIQRELI